MALCLASHQGRLRVCVCVFVCMCVASMFFTGNSKVVMPFKKRIIITIIDIPYLITNNR